MEKTPSDVYRDVGHSNDIDLDDIAAIGGIESQHGKYDHPLQGGSARGLFQFKPETAEYLSPGSSKSLSDLNTQSELMKLYLKKNKVNTAEDAFIKHNLGATRGQKFLDSLDEDLITEVIPLRVIKANPGIYNVKTIGEARKLIKKKLEEGKNNSEIQSNFLDLFRGEK